MTTKTSFMIYLYDILVLYIPYELFLLFFIIVICFLLTITEQRDLLFSTSDQYDQMCACFDEKGLNSQLTFNCKWLLLYVFLTNFDLPIEY